MGILHIPFEGKEEIKSHPDPSYLLQLLLQVTHLQGGVGHHVLHGGDCLVHDLLVMLQTGSIGLMCLIN